MILSKYTIIARIFPAVITSFPLLIFWFKASHVFKEFVYTLTSLNIIGNISVTFVVIYFIAQISRFIGKEIFERIIFKSELHMPTTNLLLNDDTFTTERKNSIKYNIYNDFNIKVPLDNENYDKIETRKLVSEAVGYIRNKLRSNVLLLQHNIEYGFIRNLIGGCLLSFAFSIFNIYYFCLINHVYIYYVISIVLSLFYIFILLISKYIMQRYGILYAKILFQEYLSLSK